MSLSLSSCSAVHLGSCVPRRFASVALFSGARDAAAKWAVAGADQVSGRPSCLRDPFTAPSRFRSAKHASPFHRVLQENGDATAVLQALMTLHGLLAHDVQACAASAMEVCLCRRGHTKLHVVVSAPLLSMYDCCLAAVNRRSWAMLFC